MGPYLLEKRTLCWWLHQNKRNVYYLKSNFSNLKRYVCQIFLPSFNRIKLKMEKRQLFQNRLFLALFILNREKWGHNDVIVDFIRILFLAKYSPYPKVILYKKIWVF